GGNEAIALEQALLAASRGHLTEVEQFLLTTAEKKPALAPLVWQSLVEGYTRLSRVLDALSVLERWLAVDPDNPQALLLRADLRRHTNALHKAIPDYRRVLEIDPGRRDARWRFILCLLGTGGYDEALRELQEVEKQRPDDPEVLVRMARCYFMQGRAQKARGLLDAVLEKHPQPGLAWRT